MKISTEINSIAKNVGEEKAVELVAKAGFDAWDFSMFNMCGFDEKGTMAIECEHPLSKSDYLKYARKLRKIGEDNGIVCNQSHAPMPTPLPGMRKFLKRAIECTAEAGGKICVIHPGNNLSPQENAEMFFDLLPLAKECNVKIATENMWNWNQETDKAAFAACATADSFLEHLNAVNDDYFVACLDLGHAEMMGETASAEGMILALKDKLQALHIHDNDRWHDSHQIPFSMNMDFKKIVNALKKIDYKGDFTLEAGNYIEKGDEETTFKRLFDLKNAVRRMADMFEEL